MKFTDKVKSFFRKAKARIVTIARIAIDNVKATLKNLWRNAESVAILSLASLGTAHFVGSYVFENPALNSIVFAEMIGPVASIAVIWGLLRLAAFRRNRRTANA